MELATKNREQLIAECQGLVKSLASRIHKNLPRHLELDDLISYGQVGLAEAARDFDGSRGGQFTTFAYYRIRGAIYDGISKMSWVSRSQYRRIKYQQMADDVLRLEGQNDPSEPATLEASLGWLKSVTSALAVVYLSSQVAPGMDADPIDVEDSDGPSPQTDLIDRETSDQLRQLIDDLPSDARTIVRSTYFDGLTLTEAAARLGIGKAWASRLHAKALERLGRGLRRVGLNE